jgi:hypothetical protein
LMPMGNPVPATFLGGMGVSFPVAGLMRYWEIALGPRPPAAQTSASHQAPFTAWLIQHPNTGLPGTP